MVADKEFYYSTYHGKLSEADVEGCLARAEYMLHSLTLDRLQDGAWEQDETLAKCVRMAHCALADAQHAQDTAVLAGGKVTSESVGKWSRSIQQDDEQSGSFERRCLRIAAQYIPIRSGLLYRGVSGCCRRMQAARCTCRRGRGHTRGCMSPPASGRTERTA